MAKPDFSKKNFPKGSLPEKNLAWGTKGKLLKKMGGGALYVELGFYAEVKM